MNRFNDDPKQILIVTIIIILLLISIFVFLIRPFKNLLKKLEERNIGLLEKEEVLDSYDQFYDLKLKEISNYEKLVDEDKYRLILRENYDSFLLRLNNSNGNGLKIRNIEVVDSVLGQEDEMDCILMSIRTEGYLNEFLDFLSDLYNDYKNLLIGDIEITYDEDEYMMDCQLEIYIEAGDGTGKNI